MNAGAYGGEIKDILVRATLMDMDGSLFEFTNSRCSSDTAKTLRQRKIILYWKPIWRCTYHRKKKCLQNGRAFRTAQIKTAAGISERRKYV